MSPCNHFSVVYIRHMSRINVNIDDQACAEVMRLYRLTTKGADDNQRLNNVSWLVSPCIYFVLFQRAFAGSIGRLWRLPFRTLNPTSQVRLDEIRERSQSL